MENGFVVSVRCYTYNHAPYVLDTMNGFTIQQTSFPYICTIVDDASTDGEQDVIRNYFIENFVVTENITKCPLETSDYRMILGRHKINANCYFAVYFLKYNHFSIKKAKQQYLTEWEVPAKYIAICEGDDYWTDDNKLQLQLDYMDTHDDCSLCFHDVATYSIYEGRFINKFNLPTVDKDYTSRHLFTIGWLAPSASIIYRRSLKIKNSDYPDWARIEGLGGDIKWQMFLSKKGYFHYIARKMSVYRFAVPGSATERNRERRNNKAHRAYLQFISRANCHMFGGRYFLFVWYRRLRYFAHKWLH